MALPRPLAPLSPLRTFLSSLRFDMATRDIGATSESALGGQAGSGYAVGGWLRRWAAIGVALVSVLTLVTPFTEDMPDVHRVVVGLALLIIVPAWAAELGGVRWPRLVLIAAVVLPNVWLTLLGHISTNYLWLSLLVIWVGVAGGRAESLAALALSLATVSLAVGLNLASGGQLLASFWASWSFGLLSGWFLGRLLLRQERFVAELRVLRGQAEHAAVLEERQRLSRELHDSVTQSLYGISLYTEAAARALADGEPEPAVANLRDIRETTREALGEMRLLLFELRPALLQEHGLAAALRQRLQGVESRAGLETAFECSGTTRLAAEAEQALYRIAQEGLNNVLKHAHATRVRVRLELGPERATLLVADDGVGFDPAAAGPSGYGLAGMRERVQRLRGSLRIESAPGHGTSVQVEVPR